MDNDCIVTTEEIHIPYWTPNPPKCIEPGCCAPARPGLSFCADHDAELVTSTYTKAGIELSPRPLYQTTRTDYEASLKRAEGLRKRLEEKVKTVLGATFVVYVVGSLMYDIFCK